MRSSLGHIFPMTNGALTGVIAVSEKGSGKVHYIYVYFFLKGEKCVKRRLKKCYS